MAVCKLLVEKIYGFGRIGHEELVGVFQCGKHPVGSACRLAGCGRSGRRSIIGGPGGWPLAVRLSMRHGVSAELTVSPGRS